VKRLTYRGKLWIELWCIYDADGLLVFVELYIITRGKLLSPDGLFSMKSRLSIHTAMPSLWDQRIVTSLQRKYAHSCARMRRCRTSARLWLMKCFVREGGCLWELTLWNWSVEIFWCHRSTRETIGGWQQQWNTSSSTMAISEAATFLGVKKSEVKCGNYGLAWTCVMSDVDPYGCEIINV
jgi:hypothetical protein